MYFPCHLLTWLKKIIQQFSGRKGKTKKHVIQLTMDFRGLKGINY